MSRGLSDDMLTAIAAARVRPILLVAAEFSGGTVRLWSGTGSLTWDGNDYTGAGHLLGVSEVAETDDLRANGAQVTLSGIPSSLLAAALGEIEYGRPVTIWLGFMDVSTDLLVDAPTIAFRGFTDNAQISDSSDTSTISVTVENRLIALNRAQARRFTTHDQKLIDPHDKGFDFVPRLQNLEVTWGKGLID